MNKSNLIGWRTTSSFHLRTKHSLPAPAENLTTIVGSSLEIPDNSHHSSSFLLRRRGRRKKMKTKKMKTKTTTMMMTMMMMTKRTKRSNNEAVVNLKSQLYSVCSRKFVQIVGTQVNALAAPESPLGRWGQMSANRDINRSHLIFHKTMWGCWRMVISGCVTG